MWISFLLPTAFNLWDQKLLIDVVCNKNWWKLINEGSVWFQILKYVSDWRVGKSLMFWVVISILNYKYWGGKISGYNNFPRRIPELYLLFYQKSSHTFKKKLFF